MTSLPASGLYQLVLQGQFHLTLQENVKGSTIKILPSAEESEEFTEESTEEPTKKPAEDLGQYWHVQNEGDSITLKNRKHNLYAGNQGFAEAVVAVPEPFKWKAQAFGPSQFLLYIVDDSYDRDDKHYLGASRNPPQAGLVALSGQPWFFLSRE